MSTYQYIARRQAQAPTPALPDAARGTCAYYAWQRRQASVPEPAWQVAMRRAFKEHSAHHGTRRLRAELPPKAT